MIPRILHQVWMGGGPVPGILRRWHDRFREDNPEWDVRLWTDDNLPPILNREAWESAEQVPDTRGYTLRADILRYEVVARWGGVYLDMDVQPLGPLDACLFPGASAWCAMQQPTFLTNAAFGAEPDHPAMWDAVNETGPSYFRHQKILKQCGPDFVERIWRDRPDVTPIPGEYFHPSGWRIRHNPYAQHFAVQHHRFSGFWTKEARADECEIKVGGIGPAFCITLKRRQDRWEAFQNRCPMPVVRVDGVDGSHVVHPDWWTQGSGAWGCYQSHLKLLEHAREKGLRQVTVFEDDAVFCEGFEEKLRDLLRNAPSDWGQIYLGGQHLHAERTRLPIEVSEGFLRCRNVNRTHAYVIREPYLSRMIEHLRDEEGFAKAHAEGKKWHVDHWMGVLCDKSGIVYAPKRWLVGQAAGRSNVSNKKLAEKWWQHKAGWIRMKKKVVVGLFRGFEESRKKNTLDRYIRMFEAAGYDAVPLWTPERWSQTGDFIKKVRACKVVGVWNGSEPGCEWLRRLCREQEIPSFVMEWGLLPQKGNLHVDAGGLSGNSLLCGEFPLLAATDEDVDRARSAMADRFSAMGLRYEGGEEIVCPLQNWWDTSVSMHSRFKDMGKFLAEVRRKYPDRPIVVKPHPKFAGQADEIALPENTVIEREGSTIERAQTAWRVVGVNSTVLYEAFALGAPVEAMGRCALSSHEGFAERWKVLACILRQQFPQNGSPVEALRFIGMPTP